MENRRTRGRAKVIEKSANQNVKDISGGAIIAGVSAKRSSVSSAATTTVERASPARRASPGRTRLSPTRRTTKLQTTPRATPHKELKELKNSPKSRSSTTVPVPMATATTSPSISSTTRSLVTKPTVTTSSVHNSYSTTTQKTIEIRSSGPAIDTEFSKLADYIRRSVSKSIVGVTGERDGTHTPTTNTEELESRYSVSRSVSRSVYDDDRYSKAEFSDYENNDRDKDVLRDETDHYKSFNTTQPSVSTSSASALLCRKLQVPREFGGWYGVTTLMLFTPIVVYYLQWSCTKASGCVFKPLNVTAVFDGKYIIKRIFRTDAVSAYLAFNILIFILSAILPGRSVRLPSERGCVYYVFNALPIAFSVTVAAGVAEYLQFSVADFVLKHYMRFCVYGFINAYITALWSYIRTDVLRNKIATKMNIYGKTGNVLIDYALGRQINPKWLGFIELKQVFYRISLISTLVFAEVFLYKSLQLSTPLAMDDGGIFDIINSYAKNIKYNPSVALSVALLLAYIFDTIIFEHHLASSFELQGEGFGCLLLLRYAATPFLLNGVTKYFYGRHIEITYKYVIYIAALLLIIGLALKRFSNAVKYKYRINPMNPLFYDFKTIHSFQGRRLLLGALWGRLRQPNYAGDIIALLALGSPLLLNFVWPPAIGLILCIILLLHRATRLNARNNSRYHSSWVRYTTAVRYYVVPKVF